MQLIGKYTNGNYSVRIYDDGTKIRETEDNDFVPKFSESIDCKLTSKCQQNCSFCYEDCTSDGEHALLDFESPFFKSLHPYTELALNGNDMDHPQLVELLKFLKEKNVIANITVNQNQLLQNYGLMKRLQDEGLIHGIGVSLVNADDMLVNMLRGLKNTVIHTICGILTIDDIYKLTDKGLKLLILGYKDLKRGHDFKEENNDIIEQNQLALNSLLPQLPMWFDVVSFDNLALEQLNVRRLLSDKEWDETYMGDDGQFTFYIDLVKKEYAMNSLSNVRYPMNGLTIDEMFGNIRKKQ